MTVAELREKLDDYGDHLPVRIGVNVDTEDQETYEIVEVIDRYIDGELTIILAEP